MSFVTLRHKKSACIHAHVIIVSGFSLRKPRPIIGAFPSLTIFDHVRAYPPPQMFFGLIFNISILIFS